MTQNPELRAQILKLIHRFATQHDYKPIYMLEANKEYFSYIILEPSHYELVHGETNGDIITSTSSVSPDEVIKIVRDKKISELRTGYRRDFPYENSNPLTRDADLLAFLENIRLSYDAKTEAERARHFLPSNKHQAFVVNGTPEEIRHWVKNIFDTEFPTESFKHDFIYKEKKCRIDFSPAQQNGALELKIDFDGAPMLFPWSSSIGVARSLFLTTGKTAYAPPCMMSCREDDSYCICAAGEFLVKRNMTI